MVLKQRKIIPHYVISSDALENSHELCQLSVNFLQKKTVKEKELESVHKLDTDPILCENRQSSNDVDSYNKNYQNIGANPVHLKYIIL